MLKFYWQKRIWYNQCSLTSFYIFRGKIFKSSRFPRKVSVCLCLRTYHKRTFFLGYPLHQYKANASLPFALLVVAGTNKYSFCLFDIYSLNICRDGYVVICIFDSFIIFYHWHCWATCLDTMRTWLGHD